MPTLTFHLNVHRGGRVRIGARAGTAPVLARVLLRHVVHHQGAVALSDAVARIADRVHRQRDVRVDEPTHGGEQGWVDHFAGDLRTDHTAQLKRGTNTVLGWAKLDLGGDTICFGGE